MNRKQLAEDEQKLIHEKLRYKVQRLMVNNQNNEEDEDDVTDPELDGTSPSKINQAKAMWNILGSLKNFGVEEHHLTGSNGKQTSPS